MKAEWICIKCGECCRHLVGNRFGMAILPDEYWRLAAYAKKHHIDLQARPLVAGVLQAKLYQFTQERCPFLQGNLCQAYDYRPLVCRMFPLHPRGIMHCSSLDRLARGGCQVTFPDSLRDAVISYAVYVQPIIDSADLMYSLDEDWKPRSSIILKQKLGA